MNHYEIEDCAVRAKAGDRVELLKVIDQFKPFIFKTASQFNIKNCDSYDLVQIGYVALINAVTKYRTGSHTFATYSTNSVKNALRQTARNNSKFDGVLSLNNPVNSEDSGSNEFIDCIDSLDCFEEDILRAEKITEVKKAISRLPEDEIELIFMVYYSEISLLTYAKKKGITYQAAIKKRDRVLKKLNSFIKNR